jgi:hypothetical protein
LTDFRDDELILEALKTQQVKTEVKGVSLDCIHNLIRGNHFESATFAIENSKGTLKPDEML